MKDKPGRFIAKPQLQIAALPWRRADKLEILLVTSRETRRWVLPKGWPMKGRKAYAAAAREALEEAGIVGNIAKEPLGAFHYVKRLKNGSTRMCRVDVYPFEVTLERPTWLEKSQRTRRWFSLEDPVAAVDEPELRAMVQAFGMNASGQANSASKDEL